MPFVRVRRVRAGRRRPAVTSVVVHVLPLEAGAELEPDDAIAQANELPLPGRGDRLPRLAARPGLLPAADRGAGRGERAGGRPRPDPGRQLAPRARGRRRARSCRRRAAGAANGSRCATCWCRPGRPQLFLVASADFGWSADQRYDLRVSAELPKAGAEAEPNDDPAHAQAVTDGTVQGYLARGDVDVFTYTATRAGRCSPSRLRRPSARPPSWRSPTRKGSSCRAASRPGTAASRCARACGSKAAPC